MYRQLTGLFVAIYLLVDSGGALAGQRLTLGSGKKIQILKISPVKIRGGGELLTLKYKTRARLTDIETLTREVNEIWDRFIVDVERDGYQGAIISAVRSGKSKKFKIVMRDGVWHMPETVGPKKLTRKIIQVFFDRIDWLGTHKEFDAILLYIPSDFTLTLVDQTVEGEPLTLDREQFVAVQRQFRNNTAEYKFSRQILDIDMLKGGTQARVKVRVSESGINDGQRINAISRSTIMIELRGGAVLIAHTIGILQKLKIADR